MRLPRPEADRSADTSAQVGARNDRWAISHPLALSMSKGRSWFDRLTTNGQACPELAEGLTTNREAHHEPR